VVTTDAPGCREVVQPGVNGWLVPVRDAPALTAALREALSNAKLRHTYAVAGRSLVEQHFAAPIIIGKTLALYEELLRA
jgi:glycosyltransferase involved in cell wall biosynthesis